MKYFSSEVILIPQVKVSSFPQILADLDQSMFKDMFENLPWPMILI